MNQSQQKYFLEQALDQGKGVLRLAPSWVPRQGAPGRRLRLHPADLYPLGAQRGGICERWLSSTAHADNGPLTRPDEGLSYIVHQTSSADRLTLQDALAVMDDALIGKKAVETHGGWVTLGKLFDNLMAIPFHLHQDDQQAALIGQRGKPEAYFFPPQYNVITHAFPFTYFGLLPGTTKGQVIDCLRRWNEGETADNNILALSRAYRLTPGTGWNVPARILHAPGSFCTYEPQRTSDVVCMFQSLVGDTQVIDPGMIWRDVPKDQWNNYEYVVDMLDWDANLDAAFAEHYFTAPKPVREPEAMHADGYHESWITYGSPYFSAKELTVYPGRTVTIKDAAAYGLLCVQGYGRFGGLPISAPTLIRFGELTEDELFVTVNAAQEGIPITNLSSTEPLVILKHFNPDNPDLD